MPLWKQRQFTRLMKPADDEGGDLGGGASATETAIDAIGVPAQEKPAELEAKPAEPKTPEAEEAELLDGVKSERGKERIKQVFAERKALEQDITEFRDLVKSTGMSPQEFAQTLEFGRWKSPARRRWSWPSTASSSKR